MSGLMDLATKETLKLVKCMEKDTGFPTRMTSTLESTRTTSSMDMVPIVGVTEKSLKATSETAKKSEQKKI